MQIEFESTPPKRTQNLEMSTPPKKSINHIGNFSTPKQKENPESRKAQQTPMSSSKRVLMSNSKRTPCSSSKNVNEFGLSRFDQDYEIVKILGEGCFSSVHLCRSRMTGDLVAIKQAKASSMSINEVQALGTLSIFAEKSKNIVRYYHSWSENGEFYIVMEYCERNLTNLYDYHRSVRQNIPETDIKQFLKQALSGLSCMHQNRMVHLDIKPDNFLFKEKTLKIADLGLCRVTRIKKWTELDEGDSRYLAKEILNYHEGIDLTKSDVFSLGMAIYEGITLQKLPNNGEKWTSIREFGLNFSQVPPIYSRQLLEIIDSMTRTNWQERPSAAEILKKSYFQNKQSHRKNFMLNQANKHAKLNRKEESSL